MPSRPAAARASRIADIVASVPEFTIRTLSTDGMRPQTFFASSSSSAVGAPKLVPRASARSTASTTAGGAWPPGGGAGARGEGEGPSLPGSRALEQGGRRLAGERGGREEKALPRALAAVGDRAED